MEGTGKHQGSCPLLTGSRGERLTGAPPPPPPTGSSSHGVKGRSDTVRRGRVLERFAKAKGEVSPGQRPGMDGPPGVREKAEDEGGRSQRGGREAAGSGAAEKRGPAVPRRLRDGCPGPEPRAHGARARRLPLGQRPFKTLMFTNYAAN